MGIPEIREPYFGLIFVSDKSRCDSSTSGGSTKKCAGNARKFRKSRQYRLGTVLELGVSPWKSSLTRSPSSRDSRNVCENPTNCRHLDEEKAEAMR